MQLAFQSFELIKAMAETGNPNSVTDAGVGALCARSAVIGAYLNVRINAGGLTDKSFAEDIISKAEALCKKAEEEEQVVMAIVKSKI